MLAELAGRPLVRHTAERLLESDIGDVFVVSRSNDSALRTALEGLRVQFIDSVDADRGMSASLVAGLRALPAVAEAVVVALGDQPTISPEVIDRLVATWRATGKPVVVPLYAGVRSHPVLFDRVVFPELLAVRGDQGGRDVIARDPARVAEINVDAQPPADVDRQEDLRKLETRCHPERSEGSARTE
jgi:molybdenum cofactor cytidylyltransferase